MDHREELSHHVYPSTRSVVAGSRITLKRFTGLACGQVQESAESCRIVFVSSLDFIESFVVGFWTLCVKFLMESIRRFDALSKMRVRGVEGCRL